MQKLTAEETLKEYRKAMREIMLIVNRRDIPEDVKLDKIYNEASSIRMADHNNLSGENQEA